MRELIYKIRKLRELMEYSPKQMTDNLDITPRMYLKIEAGESGISVARLCQIAEILHCRPGDLLNESLDNLRIRYMQNSENPASSRQPELIGSKFLGVRKISSFIWYCLPLATCL